MLSRIRRHSSGFAGAIEYGRQSYRINPDPLALTDSAYFGPRYGDGRGDRDHWSAAGELRMPLLSSLQASQIQWDALTAVNHGQGWQCSSLRCFNLLGTFL